MAPRNLTPPHEVRVNRSDLRQNQRETLKKAKDNTVVVIGGKGQDEEKLVLDKKYFDALVLKLRSLTETLQITMDQRLFNQIMQVASRLEDDTRLGKLHSFEEVFGEE